MDIAGKVFIVTGGASGLGEGTARMLAANGGKVVIADMQVEKGEAIAKEIGGAFVKCDVSQEADAQAVVAKAVAMGKLMGLVNCAGIAPAEKTVGKNGAHSLALFSKTITVNLIGSFNMIRLAAEAMSRNEPEATGERGVMISTASVAAYDGQIGQAAYSASKGAVLALTLAMATDHLADGIRVNAVNPATTDTPWVKRLLDQSPDAKAARSALEARQPMGRLVSPAEIASAIIFLASPLQASVTGTTISIDGGMHSLRIPK